MPRLYWTYPSYFTPLRRIKILYTNVLNQSLLIDFSGIYLRICILFIMSITLNNFDFTISKSSKIFFFTSFEFASKFAIWNFIVNQFLFLYLFKEADLVGFYFQKNFNSKTLYLLTIFHFHQLFFKKIDRLVLPRDYLIIEVHFQ